MTEEEKTRIKPLDEKSDYRLWKIRVEAACEAKDLSEALLRSENPYSNETDESLKKAAFEASQRKASHIIIHALTDKPLRVIRSEVGNPFQMLAKLDERYDSKTTASRISKMTELVSLRYMSVNKDMSTHVDKMAGILEQLAAMDTRIQDELAVALLVASIEAPELEAVTAAIKTLSDDTATWDDVTQRLIEEQRGLHHRNRYEKANVVETKKCEICHMKNHTTATCFLNPRNPKNRLNLRNDRSREEKGPGQSACSERSTKAIEKDDYADKKGKKTKVRAAIARAMTGNTKGDRMMLDSGTTTHMTQSPEALDDVHHCNVPIALGDNSTIDANITGSRTVHWVANGDSATVTLSNTLAAPNLSMNLLSVPALTAKGISVLFTPKRAILMDMEDELSVIGIANREMDNLYYIGTDESCESPNHLMLRETKNLRAMMAVALNTEQALSTTAHYAPYSDHRGFSSPSANPGIEAEEDVNTSGVQLDDVAVDFKDEFKEENRTEERCGTLASATHDLWHSRLAHFGTVPEIRQMISEGNLPVAKDGNPPCDPCVKGKFRRRYKGRLTKAKKPGSIHGDLVGPIRPSSRNGYSYFLTLVDEKTRAVEIAPLKKKGHASDAVLRYVIRFERQVGTLVRSLYTDGGSEFNRAQTALREKGVSIYNCTVYASI